jgi:hypothetical protein
MRTFIKRKFESYSDRDSARTFSDAVFQNCLFVSSFISMTRNPTKRSVIRNVRIENCEEVGCTIHAAILEEIMVDGLKTHGLLQSWGTVFRHVVIRGRIDGFMASQILQPGLITKEQQTLFDHANSNYYKGVDWALDISGALFEDCDLRGIPAMLIRRDIETQVVVTRQKALAGAWRNLDLARTHWPTNLELFLQQGYSDVVLVAPKLAPDFQILWQGLDLLRSEGIAEPN